MEKDILERVSEFLQLQRTETSLDEACELIQELYEEVARLRDFEPPQ